MHVLLHASRRDTRHNAYGDTPPPGQARPPLHLLHLLLLLHPLKSNRLLTELVFNRTEDSGYSVLSATKKTLLICFWMRRSQGCFHTYSGYISTNTEATSFTATVLYRPGIILITPQVTLSRDKRGVCFEWGSQWAARILDFLTVYTVEINKYLIYIWLLS